MKRIHFYRLSFCFYLLTGSSRIIVLEVFQLFQLFLLINHNARTINLTHHLINIESLSSTIALQDWTNI